MNSRFTWGDAVIIKQNAPPSLRPGEFASICSVAQIESEKEAERLKSQVGEWVYTVEFGDGSDIQIVECYLDKDLGIIHGGELSEYSNRFVDGIASDIKMNINSIAIKIKSAPIHQAVSGDVRVSSDGCLNGKLILPQINKIVINNNSYAPARLQQGIILAFEVSDHLLKLPIEWDKRKTTSMDVTSGQIWWEQRE